VIGCTGGSTSPSTGLRWRGAGRAVGPKNSTPHEDKSVAFGARSQAGGVGPSTGLVGNAYDNSMRESFFTTLEYELIDRRRFRSQSEARMAAFHFIEGF
jgi:transposase InsO family protein